MRLKLDFICLAFLVLFNYLTNAQNYAVEWWPKEYRSFGMFPQMDSKLIGEDEESYYVFKQDPPQAYAFPKYRVEVCNKVSKEIKSFEVNAVVDGNKFTTRVHDIYFIKDRFVLFLSTEIILKKEHHLYAVNIDKEGVHGSPNLVNKIEKTVYNDLSEYEFIFSEERGKCLVINTIEANRNKPRELNKGNVLDVIGKERKRREYIMLNDDLSTLWEKEIEIDSLTENEFMDHVFATNGNLFVLIKNYVKKLKVVNYKVLSFNKGKNEFIDVGTEFSKDKNLSGLHLEYENSQLHIAGFYKSPIGGLEGIYYCKINPRDFKIESELLQPFDKKFITESEKKKGKGIDESFLIKNILIKSTGAVQLIGEIYSEYSAKEWTIYSFEPTMGGVNTLTPKNFSSTPYAIANDVIVIQLNDNFLEWAHIIPKKQRAEAPYMSYLSYFVIDATDTTYLIYNDNEKNIKTLANTNKTTNYDVSAFSVDQMTSTKATCVLVKVSSNGSITKEPLVKNDKEKSMAIIIKEIKKLKDNKHWLTGVLKNKPRFGEMSFQ